MDLRSIKPGMAAAPLFLIDPRTGAMVVPMGYGKRGNPIFPVGGGAPEPEDGDKGEDDGDDDESDEDEDSDDNEDDDSDDDESDDGDKGKTKGKKRASPESEERAHRQAARFRKERNEAREELAALKNRLQRLEEKDLKPEEVEERRRKDQELRDREREASDRRTHLELAFFKTNDIEWRNPAHALSILLGDPDEYELEFDNDGKVDRKSLRAELKRLAKANPHLVKPKKAEPKDDKDGSDAGSQGATASTMNGKRKGQKDQPTREQLARKFPALNRLN